MGVTVRSPAGVVKVSVTCGGGRGGAASATTTADADGGGGVADGDVVVGAGLLQPASSATRRRARRIMKRTLREAPHLAQAQSSGVASLRRTPSLRARRS